MVPERTHASLTDCGSTTICISFPCPSIIRRVVVTITLVVVAVPDLPVAKLSDVSGPSHSARLRPCAELLETHEPLLNTVRAFSVARIVFECLCACVWMGACACLLAQAKQASQPGTQGSHISLSYSSVRTHRFESIKKPWGQSEDMRTRECGSDRRFGRDGQANVRTHRMKWTLFWWKAQNNISSMIAPNSVIIPVSTVSLISLLSMSFVSIQCEEELARMSWRSSQRI